MTHKKNTLKGLTLIEALLWFGLAALVIVGAFAGFSGASSSSKMNQARTQLQTYIGGIKSLYNAQNDFSSVTTPLVISAGIAPSAAVDGTQLINPWGGTTTIVGATRDFRVTFNGVPRDACTAMLSSGLVTQGTIIQIGVGSTLFTTDVDPATALSTCATNSNSVVFVSR